MVDTNRINETLGKMNHYLYNHNNIIVSCSGGSDSDVIIHIIATYFRECLNKIDFVFCNTGLEYKATREHLKYLEDKYKIQITRVRGVSVVTSVNRYGVPVISKEFSQTMEGLCRKAPWAIEKFSRTKEYDSYYFSDKIKALGNYAIDNEILISAKCCDVSKKKPIFDYAKKVKADLMITGERRAEGGIRATRHKSCFEPANTHKWDKYMPLFYWDDETKQYYKEAEDIIYSDCYELWGMKRTGCVGCPFNSKVGNDLEKIYMYEPNLYKACLSVFGKSYELMDLFNIHKQKIFSSGVPYKHWDRGAE